MQCRIPLLFREKNLDEALGHAKLWLENNNMSYWFYHTDIEPALCGRLSEFWKTLRYETTNPAGRQVKLMANIKDRIAQLEKKYDYHEMGRFYKLLGSLYCEEPAPGIVLFNVAREDYGLPTRFEGVEAVCPGPLYDEDECADLEWFVITVTAYHDLDITLEDESDMVRN